MTPYKWKETENAFLAIVQPKERFVEGSIFENARHEYEFFLSGIFKDDGEIHIYALGYDKEVFDKKTAERYNSWVSDILSWNPKEEEAKERVKREYEIKNGEQERKAA